MRVLVVGASGFLGSATVEELQRRGHEVVGAARSGPGLIGLDITDEQACRRELERGRYDCVLNLAGSGVTSGTSSEETMLDTNTRGAAVLARAAARLQEPPWYLHASSSTEPLPGSTSESLYSTTKAQGTRLASVVFESAGVPHATVRIHNTYGPGQPAGRFVIDLVSKLRVGAPVTLNFPHRIRDFCFVTDVADQLANLAEHRLQFSAQMEIGTGRGVSLWDAATTIRERLGASDDLVSSASATFPDPQPVQVADTTAEGFHGCRTPFDEGIDITVASEIRERD